MNLVPDSQGLPILLYSIFSPLGQQSCMCQVVQVSVIPVAGSSPLPVISNGFWNISGQPRARDIEMMHAPVRDETGAIVRNHVHRQPFAAFLVEGDQRRGAAPAVIIEAFGRIARRLDGIGRAGRRTTATVCTLPR